MPERRARLFHWKYVMELSIACGRKFELIAIVLLNSFIKNKKYMYLLIVSVRQFKLIALRVWYYICLHYGPRVHLVSTLKPKLLI